MRTSLLVISLLACTAQAQKPDPDLLLKNAITAQQQGDFKTAISDYRELLKLRPNATEAKVNLGAALAHVGQFDAAIEQYESALPDVADKNPVLMNLALAYYKKGDFKTAQDHFSTLHQSRPSDVRIAILLGDSDVHLEKNDAAVALLTPMAPANSGNPDFNYVFGSALISVGRRTEGIALMEKVAEATQSADAYMLAGATLLQLDQYERARHDLDQALRLNPRLPGIQSLAGTARDKNGDVAAAEQAFREALQLNPDDFTANLYLGAILYKRRELTEAKSYLEKSVALNPKSSMARYENAMLKSATREYEGAARDLEALVHDDPNWLEPHVELATVYYKLHRTKEGAAERLVVDRLTQLQQEHGPGKQ